MEQELSEQGEEAAGGAAASDQFLFNIKTIKSSKGNITVDLVMDGKDISWSWIQEPRYQYCRKPHGNRYFQSKPSIIHQCD